MTVHYLKIKPEYYKDVECGRSFGASSYNQAQELRSELCPKLWEEYGPEMDKEERQE